MIIRLNSQYYIEDLDIYNVVLRKSYVSYGSGQHKSAKPKMAEKEIGYFREPLEAIKRFRILTQHEKTIDFEGDLDQYIARIENINKDAENTMYELMKGVSKNG